jgi:hypothetical protein
MKMIVVGSAIAVLTVCAGCAQDPYLKDSATLGASGQFGTPAINMQDGKRHEYVVGSRLARESRESAESIKTISRTGYKDGRDEKPGSPLAGGG